MSRALRTGGWGAAALALSVLPACTTTAGRAAPAPGPAAPAHGGGAGVATTGAPRLPVGHAGRWLVDAAGRVLVLHGVNEVVKSAPWDPAGLGFSDADAAWLAASGFDVVRLGVMASAALPAPGQVDGAYLQSLLAVARTLGAHGVLTVLDLHQDGYGPAFPGMDGFPPWMTLTDGAPDRPAAFPDEYSNPAVQQAFASFWRDQAGPGGAGLQEDDTTLLGALARTFAGLTTLLGYDVLNEPWPGTAAGPCGGGDGCAAEQQAELAPFYAKADRAIRSADGTHLVFVEPFVQFDGGTVPVSVPVPGGDHESGLSFHGYGSASGTAGGGGPGGPSGGATGQALEWSRHTGGALLDSEWGATSDADQLTAQAGALDSALMSWTYWAFDDCCGPSPGADSLLRSRAGPPTGSNANTGVVGALVRPHPLAVAGTPSALSYDAPSRILHFSWSALAAGGGSFDEKSVTSIEVPTALYPTGYTVQGRGATVTSAPCAPLLTLRLRPGVTRASILVAPGGGCSPGRRAARSPRTGHTRRAFGQ